MGVIFAKGLGEDALASYAEYQGQTNSCGEFAVAASLSLLEGSPRWLPSQEVVEIADSWTLVDTFLSKGLIGLVTGKSLRMWKGGPTTSWQVANLARRLAQKRKIKVKADVRRGGSGLHADLLACLNNPNIVPILTVAWDDKTHASLEDPNHAKLILSSQPKVSLGDLTIDYTAHVMVLVAHDDANKRWGFINSWYDGSSVKRLCWMTEEDFEETWGYSRSPFFIPWLWVAVELV